MITTFFPVHQPSIGISLRASTLSLVGIRRRLFCGEAVVRADTRALASGLLTPAATGSNMADGESLGRELRALVGPRRDRAVAVSLPDDSATIGLFIFETLPAQPAEREAIIRWRFQQEANIRGGNERLFYRSYPGESSVSVLAAVVDETVLAQYVSALAAANLLAVSIGFETLQLFDAFRGVMQPGPESYFVHQADGLLTCIALRDGRPMFMRKRRVSGQGEHMREELIGTLQYFYDRFPRSSGSMNDRSPLYYVETGGEGGLDRKLFREREILAIPALVDAREIEVIPCDWSMALLRAGTPGLSCSFLPAAACVGKA